MGHGMEEYDRMSYVAAGGTPWHQLGTGVDGVMTAETAINTANLGWNVGLRPALTANQAGLPVDVPGYFAVVREDVDLPLAIVGKKYTPLQNRECFAFFDNIVEEGSAIYHTAGSLRNGRMVWILAKLPKDLVIPHAGKEDVVEQFICLANAHDGRKSLYALFTPIRVVCQNTLSMALKGNDTTISIRHTASAQDRLREAHALMGFTTKYYQEFGRASEFLAGKTIDAKEFVAFARKVWPDNESCERHTRTENTRARAAAVFAEEADVFAPTWLAAVNAVSGVVDHTTEKSTRRLDCRLESSWMGAGAALKSKAFELALSKTGYVPSPN